MTGRAKHQILLNGKACALSTKLLSCLTNITGVDAKKNKKNENENSWDREPSLVPGNAQEWSSHVSFTALFVNEA